MKVYVDREKKMRDSRDGRGLGKGGERKDHKERY